MPKTMESKQRRPYGIMVNEEDADIGLTVGQELWYDTFQSLDDLVEKDMAEIIITAANYASSTPDGLKAGGYHFSMFDRPDIEDANRYFGELQFMTKQEAIDVVKSHGYTIHYDSGSSGDHGHGSRLYFRKPDATMNEHNVPTEYASISRVGRGWMPSIFGPERE